MAVPPFMLMTHTLETELNAPANDILEAISRGFRAKVDVKGKLAELYLYRHLTKLGNAGLIQKLEWHDADGTPDFSLRYKSKNLKIECKNLRNEVFKRPSLAYKVEIQKTRNSKDGSNTRSYRVDYFDILAVCLFNQTRKWDFVFIKSRDLEVVTGKPHLLEIMQRVPTAVQSPWQTDIAKTF